MSAGRIPVAVAAAVLTVASIAFLTLPAAAQKKGGEGANDAPEAPPPKKDDKTFPIGNSFIAVSMNGKPFTAEKPAFTLDKQFRAHGFGGCNTFRAVAYPLKEQGIVVGPLALTKLNCAKELMDAEHAFFVALRAAQKWDLVAGRLIIKGPNGEIVFDRSI